jgi:hypothetical protein
MMITAIMWWTCAKLPGTIRSDTVSFLQKGKFFKCQWNYSSELVSLFCCISNGTCTFTVTRKDGLQPINCTDPLAGSSYTIVGKKYDVDLGTLDSRGAPYTIRIEYFNVMCDIAISLQSFPLDYQSYCEFTCINCDDAEAPFRKCPNGHSLTPIGDCVNNWILHSGDFGTTRH